MSVDEIRIGIDTGGTFTDFVVAEGGRILSFKVASTPHNPAEAIIQGVERALALLSEGTGRLNHPGQANRTALRFPTEIVHGTTVATNAMLERKGARTALITTSGFEDVIEIGRQTRPELYNFMVTRPAPLVPRDLRFGVRERTLPDGAILTPLDTKELIRIVTKLKRRGVESVAVCLLFSFANLRHECDVASAVSPLGIPVSLSHVILPEYREYERTSTTVMNAYLVPMMSRYLMSLVEELGSLVRATGTSAAVRTPGTNIKVAGGKKPAAKELMLRVMQSNGGSVSAEAAAAEPVRAILSGPAGGVVGALRVSQLVGFRDIVTFDMGGTSTDVALCRGEARTTNEATVAGLPVAVPIIDIHTVGAGGGSIARVDEAGALRVGPESAGADPGPVCYGKGEEITVTDANLVLGRFGGHTLLGGEMTLDVERARLFMSKLAARMSRFSGKKVSTEQAAMGVVSVANANMERALRAVSVERGQDPRLFTLVSFGGAGGLHVAELAAALRIPRILIPRSPGTLSALGVLLGDVVKHHSRTVMLKVSGLDLTFVDREFKELERAALRDLTREGFSADRVKLNRTAAMRYVGQSFEIDVAFDSTRGATFESIFHGLHLERYGYSDPGRPTEIVSLKVRAAGITEKPKLDRHRKRSAGPHPPAFIAGVFLNGRRRETPVHQRENISPGATINGPAIILEYSSTTLVGSGLKARVDPWLNLVID